MANTPNKGAQGQGNGNTNLDSSVIKQWLTNQEKQLSIQAQEAQLKEKEISASYKYAHAALDAQRADQKDDRAYKFKRQITVYFFLGFILLLILGFVVYCLQNGHKEIAIETLKILGTAVIAGLSGFFLGKAQNKKGSSDEGYTPFKESE
jgi:hypothetical protein